ncbi:hypothetical protein TIFTF001_028150 [Ficus carica]|uniref:Uncharacterized protein n=1 Tax=Ficus carica TaxID=3494 RepID=A0AA88J137_FICCA|nr:hypothetical protein TIFTF001_028150 [Ficus carica]
MTSAASSSLSFITLGQNPNNSWPSRTMLRLGRIDNLGSYFFRNIPVFGATNQMDYRFLRSKDSLFCVVMGATIVRINSSMVTDGHSMRIRNLIHLKASACIGPFSHIHNPVLSNLVSNGILKLIS